MKTESIIPEPKLNFGYDRTHLGSVQGINNYLQAWDPDCKGIHFQGEGWYQGDDTLLIISEEGRWRVFIWEKRDPRPIFQQLLALENCNV